MRQSLIICYIGILFMASNAMAANDKTSIRATPPTEYQLEDIKISILHQTGHRLPGSYVINISGDGKASRIIDREDKTELFLTKESLVELLNEFYSIHFFELQGSYTIKKKASLLDGNTIKVFSRRLVDMSSKHVCIELGGYTKCITIMDEKPEEAGMLVKKIEKLFKDK